MAMWLTAPASPPAALARPSSRDNAAPYSARIDRELEFLASLEMDSVLESTDSILGGVARFGAWAAIVEEADKHGLSAEQEAKVARFRSELTRIQRLQLPRLRDAYGSALGRDVQPFLIVKSEGGGKPDAFEPDLCHEPFWQIQACSGRLEEIIGQGRRLWCRG